MYYLVGENLRIQAHVEIAFVPHDQLFLFCITNVGWRRGLCPQMVLFHSIKLCGHILGRDYPLIWLNIYRNV